MKIIVLHGDDTGKSYERLQKFIETAKARNWEVSYLDENALSIQENLSESSLFGNERFFILRDIKKLGKKEIEWIKKQYATLSGNLIIYSEGNLPAGFIKSLPKDTKNGHTVVIEEFKLPVLIWNFLDSITPGNSKYLLKSLHKIIEKEPVEFIFTLIARQFRDLYWVTVDPKSMEIPTWRSSKLKMQSSKFSEEKLKEIISQLTEIDLMVKTSKTDLLSALDLLIIRQLE